MLNWIWFKSTVRIPMKKKLKNKLIFRPSCRLFDWGLWPNEQMNDYLSFEFWMRNIFKNLLVYFISEIEWPFRNNAICGPPPCHATLVHHRKLKAAIAHPNHRPTYEEKMRDSFRSFNKMCTIFFCCYESWKCAKKIH